MVSCTDLWKSLKGNFKSMSNNALVNAQVWLAVIEALMAKNGLHGVHIAGCCKYPGGQRSPARVTAATLYPRLFLEARHRLL